MECELPIPSPDSVPRTDPGQLFLSRPATTTLLAIVCLCLGVGAVVANALLFKFYLPRVNQVLPLVYCFQAAVDLMVGVSAISTGAFLFYLNAKYGLEEFQQDAVAYILYVLGNVTVRVSVLYNVILITIRIISVYAPTYQARYKAVLAALILIILVWLMLISIELYLTHGFLKCKENMQRPVSDPAILPPPDKQLLPPADNSSAQNGRLRRQDDARNGSKPAPPEDNAPLPAPAEKPPSTSILVEIFVLPLTGLHIATKVRQVFPGWMSEAGFGRLKILLIKGIPFIAPSCIALLGAFLLIYRLMCGTPLGRRSKVNRRISLTVLYLTLVFVSCNIPDAILLMVIDNPLAAAISYTASIGRFSTSVVLPYANAAASPLILIVRGANIRRFVEESVASVASRAGVGGSGRAAKPAASVAVNGNFELTEVPEENDRHVISLPQDDDLNSDDTVNVGQGHNV